MYKPYFAGGLTPKDQERLHNVIVIFTKDCYVNNNSYRKNTMQIIQRSSSGNLVNIHSIRETRDNTINLRKSDTRLRFCYKNEAIKCIPKYF